MIKASIMISTNNKPDDLRNALESLRKLENYSEIEVLVTDDCSQNDIKELFQKSYPEVKFLRSEVSGKYLRHRNNMLKIARGEYVFSLDDDAWYADSDAVEKSIKVFEENPKAGILNFRVDLTSGGTVPSDITDKTPYEVGEFVGCAHALRKTCFLDTGDLYDELYFRQGEERDVAIKCLEKGYEILQVNDIGVFHNYKGSERDHQAIHAYAIRNELFFYLKYFPGLSCPVFLGKCFASHAFFCFRKRWVKAFFMGISGFFRYFFLELKKRKPVKLETARKYIKLQEKRQRG